MPNTEQNKVQLFRRMSWKQYLALDSDQKQDNQVIYIADKDIRVQVRKPNNTGDNNTFDIIFNNQYGFVKNRSLDNLQYNQKYLTPGIYITYREEEQNGTTRYYADAYFYDGGNTIDENDNGNHWYALATGGGSSGGGGVTRVNNQPPDGEGNVTVDAVHINAVFINGSTITIQDWLENLQEQVDQKNWLKQEHQYYDPIVYEGGTSNTYTQFDRGNIQISGYFEGRIDGGGW